MIWCTVPEIQSETEFFCHFGPFCHFIILDRSDLKNQNFEKIKKNSFRYIILLMYTINDNHVMYGSWYMEHNRQNFLSFLDHFLHFYPHNNPENQNFEIMKKKKASQHIIILQISTVITIMWCMVPEIWCVTDEIFCYFRPFSALLPP